MAKKNSIKIIWHIFFSTKIFIISKMIDFSILKDIDNPSFIKELKRSPKKLTSNQERKYYSTLLSYFHDLPNLEEEKGNAILLALCHAFFKADQRVSSFVKGRFMTKLPFSDGRFSEQLFDLLYIIASKDPEAFDENYDVAPLFRFLVRQNAPKCLVILSILTQRFADIKSPWQTFDFLFKCSKYFIESCPENYISLLVYLCRIDSGFLHGRGKFALQKIFLTLQTPPNSHNDSPNSKNDSPKNKRRNSPKKESSLVNEKLAKVAYTGICKILDFDPSLIESFKIDFPLVLSHLRITNLQPPVVSFLIQFIDPNTLSNEASTSPLSNLENVDDEVIYEIIDILVELAYETSKASYILMNMASNFIVASYLVKNSDWMKEQLYSQYYTTCLLTIIFRHKKLRRSIMKSPNFIPFLKNASDDQDQGTISPLMVIFRRLDNIDENFILDLSDNGVLESIVNKAESFEEEGPIRCALMIFNIFHRFDFEEETPNFRPICNYLISLLSYESSNRSIAGEMIVHYAHIPQCAAVFRKKKVADMFSKYGRSDKNLQTIARNFNREIQRS
ncbi:hypothetical protein TRFO_32899 [Tritrichomonas foetus]|uniref:Uncharacterized protein n=1 Tax=Tritrichomonas foetus TaxID=1144522 RepID=A0A1J4JMU3_9EUKA|nr:hypothetical protein TRFO_32899 [Tritrichomonas foetus]|eukprot:OHT00441.1 hypothetical protein TRFO_32899 [Tritrichomonas foetus]